MLFSEKTRVFVYGPIATKEITGRAHRQSKCDTRTIAVSHFQVGTTKNVASEKLNHQQESLSAQKRESPHPNPSPRKAGARGRERRHVFCPRIAAGHLAVSDIDATEQPDLSQFAETENRPRCRSGCHRRRFRLKKRARPAAEKVDMRK